MRASLGGGKGRFRDLYQALLPARAACQLPHAIVALWAAILRESVIALQQVDRRAGVAQHEKGVHRIAWER